MTIFSRIPYQAFDEDGEIMPAATLHFFRAGTTEPVTIYTDAELQIPEVNPVVADATGLFSPIYLAPGNYRVELKNNSDVVRQVIDPLSIAPSTAELNDAIASITSLLPLASSFAALNGAIASFTDPALLQQFIDDFAAANNALGAGGLVALANEVEQHRRELDRLNITVPSNRPTITPIPTKVCVEEGFVGTVQDFIPFVADQDTPISNLIGTTAGTCPGVTLDGLMLVADGTQTPGVTEMAFRVTDELGNTAFRRFDVLVYAQGTAPPILPVFNNVPNITVSVGETIPFADHTLDVLNRADLQEPVTFTSEVLPAGSGIIISNGTRSGTATNAGTFTIAITATDAIGSEAILEYVVTIEPDAAPVWTPITPTVGERGTGNLIVDLTPFVTPGSQITNINGVPNTVSSSGLSIIFPTGVASESTILYQVQYTAISPSGITSLSPTHIVRIDSSDAMGGGGGGGGFGVIIPDAQN